MIGNAYGCVLCMASQVVLAVSSTGYALLMISLGGAFGMMLIIANCNE